MDYAILPIIELESSSDDKILQMIKSGKIFKSKPPTGRGFEFKMILWAEDEEVKVSGIKEAFTIGIRDQKGQLQRVKDIYKIYLRDKKIDDINEDY